MNPFYFSITFSTKTIWFYDGDIFWNSNGAAGGGGKGLAKLVAESEFSHVGQIDFV